MVGLSLSLAFLGGPRTKTPGGSTPSTVESGPSIWEALGLTKAAESSGKDS